MEAGGAVGTNESAAQPAVRASGAAEKDESAVPPAVRASGAAERDESAAPPAVRASGAKRTAAVKLALPAGEPAAERRDGARVAGSLAGWPAKKGNEAEAREFAPPTGRPAREERGFESEAPLADELAGKEEARLKFAP